VSGLRHPFTGALYEQAGPDRVRVTLKERTGLFHGDGRWIEGEIREADPHLCGWISGPTYGNHRVTSTVDDAAKSSSAH
jgi:hypothetical protein